MGRESGERNRCGDFFKPRIAPQPARSRHRACRGCPFRLDSKHFFNMSGLYELPFFQGRNDFVGKVLGGFSVSGIVTAHTGFPFTPKTGQ